MTAAMLLRINPLPVLLAALSHLVTPWVIDLWSVAEDFGSYFLRLNKVLDSDAWSLILYGGCTTR